MDPFREGANPSAADDGLNLRIPLTVAGLATAYAAALSYLERHYPIKPDHIWAEVAGGVLLSLVPVAVSARKSPQLDWRSYEGAVWRCFVASGTPIILWQLGEAILREMELLHYTATRDPKDYQVYAHDTSPLALRGRERA